MKEGTIILDDFIQPLRDLTKEIEEEKKKKNEKEEEKHPEK